MTALVVACGVVAYLSVAIGAGAVMSAASWRERAHYYCDRLRARDALCHDRRCRLELPGEPVDFTFYRSRPAGGPQETSTPG